MGGRGSISQSGKGRGISGYDLDRRGGGAPGVMSEQEYLDRKGVGAPMSGYMVDKMRMPHGLTERQRRQMERDATAEARNYQQRREAARAEYRQKVAGGELRKPTNIESLMKTAKGHEDNAATHAARRALKKRGIDWRTGKGI